MKLLKVHKCFLIEEYFIENGVLSGEIPKELGNFWFG